MDDVTLVVMDTSWCSYCKNMRKTKVVERFSEKFPKVKVKELQLPDNWGDEDDVKTSAEKKAILDARSPAEKEAVKIAEANDVSGVPFVAFFDAEDNLMVQSDGAVNLKQLEALYEEAVAMLEDEGDDTNDEGDEEDTEEDDT